MNPSTLRPEDDDYLSHLAEAVESVAADRLLGLYLFGSAGCGGYEPGPSDLDVQAVLASPLESEAYRRLAGLLDHTSLTCPARRLEFVCYTQAAVRDLRAAPAFAMNFNTGRGGLHHLSLDPSEVAGHWFVLDIALGRERGKALLGPPPEEVFGPVPRVLVLDAMLEGLAWHDVHEPASANAVLNACRAWRYAETNELGSKQEGAAWVGRHSPQALPIVQAALRGRNAGLALPAGTGEPLLQQVREGVRRAARLTRP